MIFRISIGWFSRFFELIFQDVPPQKKNNERNVDPKKGGKGNFTFQPIFRRDRCKWWNFSMLLRQDLSPYILIWKTCLPQDGCLSFWGEKMESRLDSCLLSFVSHQKVAFWFFRWRNPRRDFVGEVGVTNYLMNGRVGEKRKKNKHQTEMMFFLVGTSSMVRFLSPRWCQWMPMDSMRLAWEVIESMP